MQRNHLEFLVSYHCLCSSHCVRLWHKSVVFVWCWQHDTWCYTLVLIIFHPTLTYSPCRLAERRDIHIQWTSSATKYLAFSTMAILVELDLGATVTWLITWLISGNQLHPSQSATHPSHNATHQSHNTLHFLLGLRARLPIGSFFMMLKHAHIEAMNIARWQPQYGDLLVSQQGEWNTFYAVLSTSPHSGWLCNLISQHTWFLAQLLCVQSKLFGRWGSMVTRFYLVRSVSIKVSSTSRLCGGVG